MNGARAPAPFLAIRALVKRFGGVPAVDGVSFEVERGSVASLIGPNGAGKSTLLNCISGVLRPDGGSVAFRGREIAGLPAHKVAALGLGRTFQNLRIFPRLSVLDNVLCGLSVAGGSSVLEALLRPPSLRNRERRLTLMAREALDRVELAGKASWPAGVLPYGDRKRLEMARAFVASPGLVLLDEPVAGLNGEETARVGALIRQMRQAGMTMLLVEHDMELVMGISDQVAVLDGGRLIARGTPAEVRRNPLVLEAYLGRMSATA